MVCAFLVNQVAHPLDVLTTTENCAITFLFCVSMYSSMIPSVTFLED